MKKIIISVIFVLCKINITYSQTDFSGKYWSHTCGVVHGYFLRLFPDSTAHYTPIYESAYEYEKGKWSVSNDTIIVTLNESNNIEYFRIIDSLNLDKINLAKYVYVKRLYRQEAYYPNGDIKYKINYFIDENGDNQFNGRQLFYYPNKRLKQIIEYKNGKKQGIEINFKYYGYIRSQGTWRNGKKHGDWFIFDSDFNPKIYRKYKNGKLKRENNSPPCYPGWNIETFKKLYSDD
ncbi:toxin-antitoxin system YwqK family antitoxin [Saccharicrinis sp. FJH54]|uniref:toxin-antitoxin system YwqK family antitoxin n=1 Tax=Saccharicrinis sp. FJH54 TaxID=3344665 RepID=UPI0035D3E71C